jgi:phosphomannomutase/phosphoglucomutase
MKLFGTNGIRGIVNELLTTEFASEIGLTLATYTDGGLIVVAQDPRTSGGFIKHSIIAGLISGGCDVYNLHTLPTPALQYGVKHYGADAGIMVTASHNPPEYNGVKVISKDGTELSRAEEERFENIFFSKKFRRVPWTDFGTLTSIDNTPKVYIDAILKHVDVDLIRKKHFNILLDCSNGAASYTTPYLLDKLGCRVISLNAHPDGLFPAHPSEPKKDNLRETIEIAKTVKPDITIAHDGDADRAIFIDDEANYLFGDQIAALVTREKMREHGGGTVVTAINSSQAIEDVVRDNNGTLVLTKVSPIEMARKLREVDGVIAPEETGGIIFPEHQYCRDGGMTIAFVLSILAKSGKKLSELIDELPKYYIIKDSIKTDRKEEVERRFKEESRSMPGIEKIVDIDGLRAYLRDGNFLVRKSGTEDIIRIFAESKSRDRVSEIFGEVKKTVARMIESSG